MPATPPVIVRTPFSRRRVLAWSAGIGGVLGAAKAAVWLADRPASPADATPQVPVQPTALASQPRALLVLAPADGVYSGETNATRDAVRDALPAVDGATGGRYVLDLLEVPQPATYRPQTEALAPLLATGAAPDLLVTTGWPAPGEVMRDFASPAAAGFFAPLDAHLTPGAAGGGALRLQDFYPAALDVCRHKGQLLGVPLMAAPLVLAYDAGRFALAGVPAPDSGWTWRSLRAAAGHLTGGPGGGAADEYGFFPGWNAGGLLSLIWQNSGDVVDAAGKRTRLLEPPAFAALEAFADLYRGRAVSPPMDGTWLLELRADGIRLNQRWWVGMSYVAITVKYAKRAADRPAMTEVPRGQTRATALGVPAVLSLFRRARDQGLAAEALAALADRVTTVIVPSSRRLRADELVALLPSLTAGHARAVANALDYGRALLLADIARTGEVHVELSRLMSALRAPQGPPVREAAARAAAAIEVILARP